MFKESGEVKVDGIQEDTRLVKRKTGKKRHQMVKTLFHVLAPNAEHHKVRQTQITFK